jgi:MFS family permease
MVEIIEKAGIHSALSCIADRRYGPWFVAQVFSASGGLTQMVAAAWVMYRMTHSATHLALLSAAMMSPVLLGSAWAGSLADRVDRRRLLLATQTLFALIGAGLALVARAGWLSPDLLFATAALTGVVLAVDGPARQVYVLDIVGRARLTAAVSLYEVVMNASRIVGPGIGGALLGACGPTATFAFNAACFLPALGVLVLHGRQSPRARGERPAPRSNRSGTIGAGLRYAFGTPLIRRCLMLAALAGMLFNSTVLFPLLAARAFGLGADGYALLMVAFGVGALPGALCAGARSATPTARTVGVLAVATGVSMVVTASAPTPWLAYAAMSATGFTSIWFIAVTNTLVQLESAPAMRGRVMGAWTMMLPGLGPVTGIFIATVADRFGPRIAFSAIGCAIVAVAAALAGRPARLARP